MYRIVRLYRILLECCQHALYVRQLLDELPDSLLVG